jgi:hypothetical protein
MTINELVKKALQDSIVRHNLLYNTDEILKKHSIEICIEKSIEIFKDKSMLQGGYRP